MISQTSRRGGAGPGLLTGAPMPSRKPDLRIGENLGEQLLPCSLSDRYGKPYTPSLLMVAGTEAKHSEPCRQRSDHAIGCPEAKVLKEILDESTRIEF